jgi:CRISPR-associated protein Csx10
MNNYLVTMTLESDACFGAGISTNGLVNTEVLIDDSGFPYFLAKTFKGVLKESIENILVPAEESLKDSEREILRDLRRDEFENDIKYKFTWSNFKIDQVIKEAFEDENLESLEESVETSAKSEAFMNIEQSTRITQNQVAEENSLRAIRVIKKGLVFTSVLSVNKELDDDEISFLQTCLKTVKHIGTSKNRGLGKVKLDLIPINSNGENSKKINRESKFIKYEIEIEEPVKIAKSEKQYDYEPTQKYIPGSVMRGAIISSILDNVAQNKKDETALKFIRKAKYYNAYPIYSAKKIKEAESKTKDPNRKLPEVCEEKLDKDVKLENKDYYSIPMPNIFRNNKQVQKAHKVHKEDRAKASKLANAWFYTDIEPDDIDIRNSEGKIETFNYSTIFDRKKNMDLLGSKFMNKFTPGEFCYTALTKDKSDALFAFDIETEEYFHHTHQKSHENIYRYEAIKPKYRYYGFIDISSIEESESDLKDGMINQLEKLDKLWIGGSKNTGYGSVKLT